MYRQKLCLNYFDLEMINCVSFPVIRGPTVLSIYCNVYKDEVGKYEILWSSFRIFQFSHEKRHELQITLSDLTFPKM